MATISAGALFAGAAVLVLLVAASRGGDFCILRLAGAVAAARGTVSSTPGMPGASFFDCRAWGETPAMSLAELAAAGWVLSPALDEGVRADSVGWRVISPAPGVSDARPEGPGI